MAKGKSTSASNTSTATTTTNTDNRMMADNGAIVLGDGATLETLSDDVAMAALNTAGNVAEVGLTAGVHLGNIAADTAKNVTADAFEFGGGVVDTASDLIGRQIDAATEQQENQAEFAANVAQTAIANMESNKSEQTAQTLSELGKYAAYAAVAVAALFVLPKILSK